MKTSSITPALLAALLCTTPLMACTSAEVAPAAPLHYSPAGKPGSAVSLNYTPLTLKTLGSQGQLGFTLVPESKFDTLKITVTSDSGLNWVGSSSNLSWQQLAPQQTLQVNGLVTGLSDGRHYLNVLIVTERNGLRENRSYALPVPVGSGQILNKSAENVQTNAEGERLSVTQGKETP